MKQILAALIAFLPAGALAAPITFTGSGTFDRGSFSQGVGSNITPIANPYDAPGADNSFIFSLSFETTAPDQNDFDPTSGLFEAVTGFTVSNGLCSVNVAGGDVQVETSTNAVQIIGGIRQSSDQGCVVDGMNFSSALLQFQFGPDALQSDALDPLSWPINDATVTFSLGFFQFIGFSGRLPITKGGPLPAR